MKRALALILPLVLSLAACGGNSGGGSAEDVELIVFAAASMQETLTEIGENYRAEHPNVTLTFNFDSSRPKSRRERTAISLSPPARSRWTSWTAPPAPK